MPERIYFDTNVSRVVGTALRKTRCPTATFTSGRFPPASSDMLRTCCEFRHFIKFLGLQLDRYEQN
jgi:hypothetical protein